MSAFDLAHAFVGVALTLLFALVFFGWVAYANGQLAGQSWALHALNLGRRKQVRALRHHEAVCAQCAYPVQQSASCPECGIAFDQPHAIMRQDQQPQRLPGVPEWLRIGTVLFVAAMAAWLIGPLGEMAGQQLAGPRAAVAIGYLGFLLPLSAGVGYAAVRLNRR